MVALIFKQVRKRTNKFFVFIPFQHCNFSVQALALLLPK